MKEQPDTDEDAEPPAPPDDDPSSPMFPSPATLADSAEIQDFDYKGSAHLLTSIVEEANGNGKIVNEVIHPPRRRSSIPGMDEFRTHRHWYNTSLSVDDENATCGFVQLDLLSERLLNESSAKHEWNEISRWIKYEQDLEEGSARFGRPHIAPLCHHFMTKLKQLFDKNCILLLDIDATDMASIAKKVLEVLLINGFVEAEEAKALTKDLLLDHELVSEKEKYWSDSNRRLSFSQRTQSFGANTTPVTTMTRRQSLKRFVHRHSTGEALSLSRPGSPSETSVHVSGSPIRRDSAFPMFSAQAESTMLMVRGGYKRRKGVLILIRLATSILLNEDDGKKKKLNVNIPTRFLAILLAPSGQQEEYVEIGKTLGTVMSNTLFYKTALIAQDSKDFISALNEFLDESIVLPPGEWYSHNFYDLLPVHHLEVKCDLIHRQRSKVDRPILERSGTSTASVLGGLGKPGQLVEQPDEVEQIPGPFVYMGKPFGGLINDIKRRYPFYKSDFLDGLNMQTVAVTIFLYFASIAHNVTFGGLLGQKTKGLIGVGETLVAAALSGSIFALFAGMPMCIIAPTGPLLVFDELLFKFMERHSVEFLPARVWIGMWVVIFALIAIALEASVLVKMFTRFTMETFSGLISVIFVYECMESLIHTYKQHPLSKSDAGLDSNFTSNMTALDGIMEPKGEPNTALLTTFLMFGTFIISFKLKHIRTSTLFGEKIRKGLSDFGVPIGIMLMVSVDYFIGDVYTTKIKVPAGLEPTTPDERGWVINPFGMKKDFDMSVPFFCVVPGFLVFFLMFMTVEICEKIMASNPALKKGCGFHLDPLILALTNFGCGVFGFPWVSVATLKALAHIAGESVFSKNDPPGIPPSIVKVRENRVSNLVMSIMIGLSIFLSPVLKLVPMPVLFGVFLYMGITSLMPTQFYERLLLFLTPTTEHPQTIYVRRVPTWKIHLYTVIQIACLATLWAVKSVKEIALFFPLILMFLIPIRRSLGYFYTENELEALDGGAPAKPVVPSADKTSRSTLRLNEVKVQSKDK